MALMDELKIMPYNKINYYVNKYLSLFEIERKRSISFPYEDPTSFRKTQIDVDQIYLKISTKVGKDKKWRAR